MKRILLVGLVLMAWGLLAPGVLSRCFSLQEVEVRALDATPKDAFSTAAAQAVAQARGLFISVQEQVKDVFKATLSDQGVSAESLSFYQRDIQSRYSGLIEQLSVLGQGRDPSGLFWVHLRARVCLDPIVAVFGAPEILGELRNALPSRVGIYFLENKGSFSPKSAIKDALVYGASYIALVEERLTYENVSVGGVRGVSVTGVVSSLVWDIRNLELVAKVDVPVRAIARGLAEARFLAVKEAALPVAEAWTKLLSTSTAISYREVSLSIGPIRRQGNRNLVIERVQRVPGILEVKAIVFKEVGNLLELSIKADPSSDTCTLARMISGEIKSYLQTQVRKCTENTIELFVYQE